LGSRAQRTLPDSVLTYWEGGAAVAHGTVPATNAKTPNATISSPIARRWTAVYVLEGFVMFTAGTAA